MSTQTTTAPVATQSPSFERFAGIGGIITGIFSLLYAVFFLLVSGHLHDLLPPIFLGVGGLLATAVMVAVYGRVRDAEPGFALWALLLGATSGVGTAVSSAYSLANVVSGITLTADQKKFPNQADPRGFLTFGLTGVAFLVIAWLIVRSGRLPRGLGYLGYANGVLILALYLGTLLTSNDTKSLFILVPGGLASLIATPVWYLWIGSALARSRAR